VALAAPVAGCDSSGSDEPAPPPPPPRITLEGLTDHLRALDRIAERNGGERATGTPGYRASVKYVARVLRAAGWRVRIEGVPLREPIERSAPRLAAGSVGQLRPWADFRTLTYSGAGSGSGLLRRVGSGCRPADVAALRPGEVALAARGGCFFRVKAANARGADALGLLVETPASRRGVASATLARPVDLPALLIAQPIAARLEDGDRVSLRVDTRLRRGRTWNVIAEAGTGEGLVMAGAHLDSVPRGPGINDNGSGVASLLEVARVLGPRPGRRVRLAFWGAEELGLGGSRHYVGTLSPRERRAVAAYINLDMVGSPNAVPALYRDGDERLTRILRGAHPGREAGVPAEGRSDHAPFDSAGIPVGGLYTGADERGPGGEPRDPCYHLPCDTLANVDGQVLLRMARATLRALRGLPSD
jgi:hypothetical protein